jgi:hypothetical protein
MKVKSTINFSNASTCKSPMPFVKCFFENFWIPSMQLTQLEFQVFQIGFKDQKIPQSDKGKKDPLVFKDKSILMSPE